MLFIGALFGPDIIEADLRTEELNYMCDKLQLVADLKGNEKFNNFSWEIQMMYAFVYVALDEKNGNFIVTSRDLLSKVKQVLDNQQNESQPYQSIESGRSNQDNLGPDDLDDEIPL